MTDVKTGTKLIIESIEPRRIAFLDCETTGLNPTQDEIIELSIVDGTGAIVYSQRFEPLRIKHWPYAQMVNGIAPADVAGLPHIAGCVHYISRIFNRFDAIIGYNVGFDLGFIRAAGIDTCGITQIGDAMDDISNDPHDGQSCPWIESSRLRLCEACRRFGFESVNFHNSISDSLATALITYMRAAPYTLEDFGMGIPAGKAWVELHIEDMQDALRITSMDWGCE